MKTVYDLIYFFSQTISKNILIHPRAYLLDHINNNHVLVVDYYHKNHLTYFIIFNCALHVYKLEHF